MKSKLLFFGLFIVTAVGGHAAQEMALPLDKSRDQYERYEAAVYDGVSGKTFPYRITVSQEISGCTGAEFKVVEVSKFFGTVTYFFQLNAITPAVICQKSSYVYSKSFDFPKGAGFINLIMPSNVHVTVEKIN